jgi:hypothetical protein
MSRLCANFLLVEMHKPNGRCDTLIEETAGALNDEVIALMLVAVQRGNVELSVKVAVERLECYHNDGERYIILPQCSVYDDLGLGMDDTKDIVKRCLVPFPYLWVSVDVMSVVVHAY